MNKVITIIAILRINILNYIYLFNELIKFDINKNYYQVVYNHLIS